uniref:C2H2-type domain-containing protein n=1 Tax=Anopheles farauti TaxID=69004 RepID=A0A182QD23_9DIPT
MEQSITCVLCLSGEAQSFLKVYIDESQESDIAATITKHLWVKPTEDSYVCNGCWKCLDDFHQFYIRLESIHSEEQEESQSNPKDIRQYLFEFHPVEDIKIEQLEGVEVEEAEQVEQEYEKEVADHGGKADRSSGRPKRASAVQATYRNEESDAEWEKDYLATNDDDEDIDDGDYDEQEETKNARNIKLEDDDDEDEVINYDKLNRAKGLVTAGCESKPVENTQPSNADPVPVKRGRGRPPKIKTEGTIKPIPAKKQIPARRGRRRKVSITSSESDLDFESDLETLEDKYRKYSKGGQTKKSPGTREMRDKRIFSYVSEFICYHCPEKITFERFHHANQHYKQVHNEPAFLRCPKCSKKCFTPGGFVSHMETHEDPDRNKCKICGKVTDQQITLKKHMRAHQEKLEKDYPFPCSQCTRRFEHEEKRDKHERLHGRKVVIKKEKGRDLELLEFYKRIYCEICEDNKPESTSFDNFWDLKVHMGNEHNKAPYLKCPICFKKNVCRQQLMVHVDVHNNPENYRCEVCKEIHQNLEKHMIKAHTADTSLPDEKNYSCEHCGKMFKYQTNLRSHIDRVHGVKDVCCNICNKYFNHKALSAHKRSAHTDEMFMCEHCPKMFKTRSGLESHKGDHDETQRKSVKCNLCGKEMRRGASMAKHMKTIHSQEDPVNCNLCGKTFRTSFHMLRHRANTCAATINSRPYKCEVCGKGFAMKLTMTEHMTTHTRTSLYQCAFCFKTFGYISNLYKHRKKAHPLEWQEVQARPEQGIATVIEIRN